jgi:hypothetical protein
MNRSKSGINVNRSRSVKMVWNASLALDRKSHNVLSRSKKRCLYILAAAIKVTKEEIFSGLHPPDLITFVRSLKSIE